MEARTVIMHSKKNKRITDAIMEHLSGEEFSTPCKRAGCDFDRS